MRGDVYRNLGAGRETTPYLLDVQADLLESLSTRVVVPLVRAESFGRPVARLHPVMVLGEERFVLATHLLAAVRRAGLGAPVASLAGEQDRVMAALDVLYSGV